VSVEGLELKGDQEGQDEPMEAVKFVSNLQEQSGSMEGIEEPKAPEDQSETSVATDKERMCNVYLFYIIYILYLLTFC